MPQLLMTMTYTRLKDFMWCDRWLVQNHGFNKEEPNKILDFFIFGVTIIVVAVPEGLPLAVTISLAYRYGPATAEQRPWSTASGKFGIAVKL